MNYNQIQESTLCENIQPSPLLQEPMDAKLLQGYLES